MKQEGPLARLLGTSPGMEEIRVFAGKAAKVRVPVLILGETGTGKSLLGRLIHGESPRAGAPYEVVNCAGVPDSLFESEFFGHQRGAFTGAREGRRGLLEQAHGGTLFLDEVGELSLGQQAKLLLALEEGEIRRLGGEETLKVDVRVISATSRDLPGEVKAGEFRRDLFHRLAVLVCHIPPLRARREDVAPLAGALLRSHQERHRLPLRSLPARAVAFLEGQPWRGNVRELSHLLEAALILSGGSQLDERVLREAGRMAGGIPAAGDEEEGAGERASSRCAPPGMEEERVLIRAALARARGNESRAARELGMSRSTLRGKLERYRLSG